MKMNRIIFWGCLGLCTVSLVGGVVSLIRPVLPDRETAGESAGSIAVTSLDAKEEIAVDRAPVGHAKDFIVTPDEKEPRVLLNVSPARDLIRETAGFSGSRERGDETPLDFAAREESRDKLIDTKNSQTDIYRIDKKFLEAIVSQDAAVVFLLRMKFLALEEESIPDLINLLNCGVKQAELEAFRLLSQIGGDKSAAIALGHMLTLESDDPYFPQYLAAFSSSRNTKVSKWLVSFLGRTDSKMVRERVLMILKHLRGESVVLDLADSIEQPLNELHADNSAIALSEIVDPSHVRMLEYLLRNRKSKKVRKAAASAMASVGTPLAAGILIASASTAGPDAEPGLESIPTIDSLYAQEELLKSASDRTLPTEVRAAVVVALSNQNSPRVQTDLQHLVIDEPDEIVRSAINDTLSILEENLSSDSQVVTDSAMAEADSTAVKEESWF